MASKSESGQAKNIVTFETVIKKCEKLSKYNPSNPLNTISALKAQLSDGKDKLKDVKVATTANDIATKARAKTFKPIKKFTTRVMGALKACDDERKSLDKAKSSSAKIQGQRIKAISLPEVEEGMPAPEAPKTRSVSQQSFDKTVDNFEQLVTTIEGEPLYAPNEDDLKLTALQNMVTDLRDKNTAVIETAAALEVARIARDDAFNNEITGMLARVQSVKGYVRSLYSSKAKEFLMIDKLKMKKIVSK